MGTHPVSERLNAERLVVLGWSRAVLMQLAHPLLAAGIAEHSTFREGPLVAVRRLRSTVDAMLALTFGSVEDTARTVGTIRAIHRRVNGRLREPVGRFPAGAPYSAEDPALVLWVHITLLDSILMTSDRLVAPVSAADRDRFCVEARWLPVALGAVERDVPTSAEALAACLDGFVRSGDLAVGGDARVLSRALLSPPGLQLAMPITRVNRLFTVGTLPSAIRDLYGFDWSPRMAARLRRAEKVIRAVRPAVPSVLALWPHARAAARRTAE
jgi:uncharacterized protein (DUF2236 family)